jgi:hypothetical protein
VVANGRDGRVAAPPTVWAIRHEVRLGHEATGPRGRIVNSHPHEDQRELPYRAGKQNTNNSSYCVTRAVLLQDVLLFLHNNSMLRDHLPR